ncbi:MAG TPA: hypothetical protein VLG76_08315 [Rhabdochlamydiaceae bacterium]|nr:hypothetical protein [Rhabdochlamydiaceae bacterium]
MELKNFIKHSLVEIISGVKEASSEIGRHISFVRKDAENVQFDIAVTIEDSKGKEGGIQVAKLFSGGVNSETKNATISRVSFQLYIHNENPQKS